MSFAASGMPCFTVNSAHAQLEALFVAAKRLIDNYNATVGSLRPECFNQSAAKHLHGQLLHNCTVSEGSSAPCLSSHSKAHGYESQQQAQLVVQCVWHEDTKSMLRITIYCLLGCTIYSGVGVNLVGGL